MFGRGGGEAPKSGRIPSPEASAAGRPPDGPVCKQIHWNAAHTSRRFESRRFSYFGLNSAPAKPEILPLSELESASHLLAIDLCSCDNRLVG